MSYELRKGSKTNFIERHLFNFTSYAIRFPTQRDHNFEDAILSMGTQIAFGISFDEKEFNQYYWHHLAKPAKQRIEALLQHNFFVDPTGQKCK